MDGQRDVPLEGITEWRRLFFDFMEKVLRFSESFRRDSGDSDGWRMKAPGRRHPVTGIAICFAGRGVLYGKINICVHGRTVLK